MLYVQLWAPDDGRRNCLKHVENCVEINKLCNFTSCGLYLVKYLRCRDPWTSNKLTSLRLAGHEDKMALGMYKETEQFPQYTSTRTRRMPGKDNFEKIHSLWEGQVDRTGSETWPIARICSWLCWTSRSVDTGSVRECKWRRPTEVV